MMSEKWIIEILLMVIGTSLIFAIMSCFEERYG